MTPLIPPGGPVCTASMDPLDEAAYLARKCATELASAMLGRSIGVAVASGDHASVLIIAGPGHEKPALAATMFLRDMMRCPTQEILTSIPAPPTQPVSGSEN